MDQTLFEVGTAEIERLSLGPAQVQAVLLQAAELALKPFRLRYARPKMTLCVHDSSSFPDFSIDRIREQASE